MARSVEEAGSKPISALPQSLDSNLLSTLSHCLAKEPRPLKYTLGIVLTSLFSPSPNV